MATNDSLAGGQGLLEPGVTGPTQPAFMLFGQRNSRFETRMNENLGRRFVVVDGGSQEIDVLGGEIVQRTVIAVENFAAPVHQPVVAGEDAIQHPQQHLLVIAFHEVQITELAQFEQPIDDLPRARAAIDDVTDQNYAILRSELKLSQQGIQGRIAAVNVSQSQNATTQYISLSSLRWEGEAPAEPLGFSGVARPSGSAGASPSQHASV